MQPGSAFSDDPIDLSTLEDEYAQTAGAFPSRSASTRSTADSLPDGYYPVRIEDARLSRVQSTGNPMILWKLRVVGAEHAGCTLTKLRVITPKTLSFVREDFRRLGIELDRLADLQPRLGETLGREIGVFKRQNPTTQWTDVWFVRENNGQESEDAPARKAPGAEPLLPAGNLATGTDDDLPF